MTAPKNPFTFYLGTHVLKFMANTTVPLFISRRVLSSVKFPTSHTTWALDSGGFTELSMYGKWKTSPGKYAAEVKWWWDTIPGMQWAAVQDWMCEPFILKKTGKTVFDHQRYTIDSYLRLKELQPSVHWVPVIQGYSIGEYLDHIVQYEEHDIDLTKLPVVGIGSVCRRQSTDVDYAELIIREVANVGIRLHAFGFKTTGLAKCSHLLASADSMAWSLAARRECIKLPECRHAAKNCANCMTYAMKWRDKVMNTISQCRK